MNFCFYDSSGRITSILSTPDETYAVLSGDPYIECDPGTDDTLHYVSAGVVQDKAPFTYTQSIAGLVLTITGLPAGAAVTVIGDSMLTDDKPTEIEFELPGTYTIRLSGLVEYRDETLEVTVG